MIQPGTRLENYVVIEKIGQGGQAAVWSAQDERLKRTVAIKTISRVAEHEGSTITGSLLTTPDRFREEAQIIAGLEHPNILPVYGFGQADDLLYIIMRYMPSGSLRDYIHRGTPDLHTALDLIGPLADALDLAHQHRILHRDLKTANVLLDAQKHPYLADFGLSMTIGGSDASHSGTPLYMSPEQLSGATLDQQSDLYSFGILIYEVLNGEPPRVEGFPWNVRQVTAGAPLPASPRIPASVMEVLVKSTAFDPKDRYNSANEIAAALNHAAEALDVHAPPVHTKQVTGASHIDPAQQAFGEARELFSRALERWADGAGRFRLEAGDFKYIASFFDDFNVWDITLDAPNRRLLLRAALEHGYEVEKWSEQASSEADRRAVALQTLTSDSPSARHRAMLYLADLPDSDPPAIPIRVASLIAGESDAAVRWAGVKLLEKRVPNGPNSRENWRPHAFEPYVDGVLAQLAMQDSDPAVAEAAARACARIRSFAAITAIVAHAGEPGARAALVFARDEVRSFPSEVPAMVRWPVFLALSLRQLGESPLASVGHFIGAALGFGIGLGTIVYLNFNDANGLLASQRLGTALAVGALYGAALGIGLTAAAELSARLRAWALWGRIGLAWLVGLALCGAAFAGFHRFFYFNPVADWSRFLVAIIIFVAGFAIAPALTRRTWIRALAGSAGVLFALYFGWKDGIEPLIILNYDDDSVSLLMSLWIAMTTGGLTFAITAFVSFVMAQSATRREVPERAPVNADRDTETVVVGADTVKR